MNRLYSNDLYISFDTNNRGFIKKLVDFVKNETLYIIMSLFLFSLGGIELGVGIIISINNELKDEMNNNYCNFNNLSIYHWLIIIGSLNIFYLFSGIYIKINKHIYEGNNESICKKILNIICLLINIFIILWMIIGILAVYLNCTLSISNIYINIINFIVMVEIILCTTLIRLIYSIKSN
jgi:hypothetical protein